MEKEEEIVELPQARWAIGLDWFQQNNRSISVLIEDYLCPACAKKFSDQGVYINGCPPTESSPLQSIVERSSYQPLAFIDACEKRRRGELPYLRDEQSMVDNVKPFLDYLKRIRGG